MTATADTPTWNGKIWSELSDYEWKVLRESNQPLWHQFVIASEQCPAKLAPTPAAVPAAPAVPSCTLAEVTERFYTVEETKALIKQFFKHYDKTVTEIWVKQWEKHCVGEEGSHHKLNKQIAVLASTERVEKLENTVSGLASATRVAEQQIAIDAQVKTISSLCEQMKQLRALYDKQAQQLSANQKHCQALERKIGQKA